MASLQEIAQAVEAGKAKIVTALVQEALDMGVNGGSSENGQLSNLADISERERQLPFFKIIDKGKKLIGNQKTTSC